ncbi:uncharacterized protein [Magallana gigas]|uniref:uncharacterized protein n=1 Tax=Magallana gigas TaxID=29159 RepID=UPI00333EDD6E
MKTLFFVICLCIPFTKSHSVRSYMESDCSDPEESAIAECFKPRDPCCYLATRYDVTGCFLGCNTRCLKNRDPSTCNTCPDPDLSDCLQKPPGCEIGDLFYVGVNYSHGCFQKCLVQC